ncbi:hypothetical protein SAMN05216345_10993 [Cupriavidus sp. YR651]|nr:hypothetical protein SAMN05216345_10993 [Cupriavidus sp. YR651]
MGEKIIAARIGPPLGNSNLYSGGARLGGAAQCRGGRRQALWLPT